MRKFLFAAAAVIALALPSSAFADLVTITDGGATFTFDTNNGGAATGTSLEIPNSPVNANWLTSDQWFLRVSPTQGSAGSNELLQFRTGDTYSTSGNTMTLTYRDRGETTQVEGTTGPIDVEVVYTLTGNALDAASLGVSVRVTNTNGGTNSKYVEVLNYFNYDVYGTSTPDHGSFVGGDSKMLRFDDDETNSFTERSATGATLSEIDTASSLFGSISGNNDLSDAVDTASGDLAGAFQWNFEIDDQSFNDFSESSSAFAVPEPSTYAFLGFMSLCIGCVVVIRRRKAKLANAEEQVASNLA